jgi:hypothetical protein
MKRKFFLCLVSGLFLAEGMPAASGDVYAELMSSPEATSWVSPGSAFLSISVDEGPGGMREDCFGFYETSRPGQVFIGGPALSGFFRKNTAKFSKISWSLRKKISETQRQQFLSLVAKVNGGGYDLMADKTGDFVSQAVDLFGWRNVSQQPLPETYVRDIYVANLAEFEYPAGKFKRDKDGWEELKNANAKKRKNGPPSFSELNHDDSWLILRDATRQMDIRLPLKGGTSQWKAKGDWADLYKVVPKVD